jgi:CheY-like chemotaxis protein
LQRHPLARKAQLSTGSASEYLRRELIAAIESLSPGADISFRAPPARLYNLLHMHYVEGMTIQEAAHELGISKRQAYRDLRYGEESVAATLWASRSVFLPDPDELRTTQLSSLQAEMNRIETHPRPTDLGLLIQQAHESVERVASQRSVNFNTDIPSKPVIVSTDPVVARQVLVSTLSRAVQQAQPGIFQVLLTVGEDQALVTMRYFLEPVAVEEPVINEVVAQLVNLLGWRVRQEDQPGGIRLVSLYTLAKGPTVLVIDDNEGLVELLERYLTGHDCRVIAATNGREGLWLSQEVLPHAIVLDVMMPEMDGWEVLQRLQSDPQTATIPVIICSVFNDPQLAQSLGASFFLPKPVSRDKILDTLRQLGVV